MIWPESISKTVLHYQTCKLQAKLKLNIKVKNRFPFRRVQSHGKGGVKDGRPIAVVLGVIGIEIYFIEHWKLILQDSHWITIVTDWELYWSLPSTRTRSPSPASQTWQSVNFCPALSVGGSCLLFCREKLTWNCIGNLYQVSPQNCRTVLTDSGKGE